MSKITSLKLLPRLTGVTELRKPQDLGQIGQYTTTTEPQSVNHVHNSWDPFNSYGLTLIPAGISNCMPSKVRDEIA